MEYKNLIPIFKKVKPSLNFNEQDIFKRKINQRKNDININNIIDNFTERKQIKNSLYDKKNLFL